MRNFLLKTGLYVCLAASALFGCDRAKFVKVHYNGSKDARAHYIEKPRKTGAIWAIDEDGNGTVDEAVSLDYGPITPNCIWNLHRRLEKTDITKWKHYFVSDLPKKDHVIVTDNSEEMPEEMRKTLDMLLKANF